MKVVRIAYPMPDDASALAPIEGQTMAIGDFDGVHLGHQEVIGRAVSAGRRLGLPSSVMTFHPHPREVLGSPVYSEYLTPLERKQAKFAELGADALYVVAFDPALARLAPEAFVDRVLKPLKVKHVAVGFNFTFGHKGAGTPAMLRQLGEGAFEVDVVEPYAIGGERVSSTLIREALSVGDVEKAAKLLGRPYAMSGVVVRGEGRGRKIGVPTANVSIREPVVKPAGGVYAVTAEIATGPDRGQRYGGVLNAGRKPTFHDRLPELVWETHLFGYEGDLYGQTIDVKFHSKIRDERKFPSVDALIAQIRSDMDEAKRRIGAIGIPTAE